MTERHVGGGTEDAARRRPAAGAWAAPHGRSFLSPAESRRRQTGSERGSTLVSRELGAGSRQDRSGRTARAAGDDACCRSHSDPTRADARLGVRVLSRRRAPDGRRPRHDAELLEVQLCGDAHLSNFGFFGSPERHLVFDINDFDETTRGPWEWDVKRLAASLEVAGRESEFGEADRSRIVRGAVHSYRQTMRTMSHMSMLGLVSAS